MPGTQREHLALTTGNICVCISIFAEVWQMLEWKLSVHMSPTLGNMGKRRGAVTGLAYHPAEDLAVTTGDDGTFRVWARAAPPRSRAARAAAAAPAPAARGHWLCRSVGSYRGTLLPAHAGSAGMTRA